MGWIINTGDMVRENSEFMNTAPKYLTQRYKVKGYDFMRMHSINAVFILDKDFKLVEIIFNSSENDMGGRS